MGDMEAARRHLQKALAIWKMHPDQSWASTTFICWGEWCEEYGDTTSAHSHYERALEILTGRVLETHRDWQRVKACLARLRDAR
jgi:predicted negative regulator of RcsB-dependent stress response